MLYAIGQIGHRQMAAFPRHDSWKQAQVAVQKPERTLVSVFPALDAGAETVAYAAARLTCLHAAGSEGGQGGGANLPGQPGI